MRLVHVPGGRVLRVPDAWDCFVVEGIEYRVTR
jgi:hypothetical protein